MIELNILLYLIALAGGLAAILSVYARKRLRLANEMLGQAQP